MATRKCDSWSPVLVPNGRQWCPAIPLGGVGVTNTGLLGSQYARQLPDGNEIGQRTDLSRQCHTNGANTFLLTERNHPFIRAADSNQFHTALAKVFCLSTQKNERFRNCLYVDDLPYVLTPDLAQ